MTGIPEHPDGASAGSGGTEDGDTDRPLGGWVRRSGIALVRRDEMVVPFEGSEAEIVLAEQDSRRDIHVHLPVTVEIAGGPDPREMHAAVDEALRRVRHAMDAHSASG
ncbi:hypothetical protein [Streptomyces sp. RKAG337]|uniref:hypothetical protein n=1 Tax=Streptomyces sp. RKAG337 TaxID=2893404 RepID=UPI00203494DC|nr:hypothetical protein [Streptomyces sp. RKAG337]MCM2424865.1 hypothetical protein [Streptomyces sp. RKAG337]